MILGGEWFNDLHLPLIHDLIWLTYCPGQMFIVYSIAIAGAVFCFWWGQGCCFPEPAGVR